jgi:hypothetical protein
MEAKQEGNASKVTLDVTIKGFQWYISCKPNPKVRNMISRTHIWYGDY